MPRALSSQETPNDITQTGVYIASGQTGLPYGYGVLIHIATANQSTGYNAVQTLYKWDASQSWQRTKVDGTWKEWVEIVLSIPSFYKNYATLQSLLSAVFASTATLLDANSAPIGLSTLSSTAAHLPVSAQLLCLTLGAGEQFVQLAFRFINGEMYARVYNGTAWGSWYKIDTTIVQ